MSRKLGASPSMAQELVGPSRKPPHLIRTYKVSRNLQFADQVQDIPGLQTHPPERPLLLCAHDKSHIWVLDRTQRDLPVTPGLSGTMADHLRHRTKTLFAVIKQIQGRLLWMCHPPPARRMDPLLDLKDCQTHPSWI
jgi:hypothetical protein